MVLLPVGNVTAMLTRWLAKCPDRKWTSAFATVVVAVVIPRLSWLYADVDRGDMSLEFLNGMPSIIFDRFTALNAAETLDCQRAFATECEQKRFIFVPVSLVCMSVKG